MLPLFLAGVLFSVCCFMHCSKDACRQMTETVPKRFEIAVDYDIGGYGIRDGRSVVITQNNTFTSRTLSAYEVLMQTVRLNKQLGGVLT